MTDKDLDIAEDKIEFYEPNKIKQDDKSDEYFSLKKLENIRIKDLNEFDRPMEKLKFEGCEYLSDAELFAILLGTGTRDCSALDLANRLLVHIGNHEALMDTTVEELMQIKGIGLAKASRIVAGLELGKRLSRRKSIRNIKINSPSSIADIFMERYKYEEKEHFSILLLDTKNQIIGEVRVSTGDLNKSIVNPREVFKIAIKKSANSIILVHNHPSGDARASNEDINVTRRLIEAGEIIGIKILDHLIIGYNEYFSMKEENII
ncbi:MAG: DNA repair protein RadC [Tissierellia bacterium]|nr:DNA repair protein RadC [Tissierellia bacterium]